MVIVALRENGEGLESDWGLSESSDSLAVPRDPAFGLNTSRSQLIA